jgi:hypothetical protein
MAIAVEFVSLAAIIQDILHIIRGSKVTREETISWREVENWIHQYRALLIKRDIDKNKYPNPDYVQEIQCLKMIVVDKSEDSTISTNKLLLRSELQLPKTIDLNYGQGFTYIGTLDGRELQLMPQSRARWQKDKYYTSTNPFCYYKNRYLYLDNDFVIEYLSIRGIFEVPTEVTNFTNSMTDVTEATLDTKYPIPITMLPALKEMILKEELNIMTHEPTDEKNDSSNSTLISKDNNGQNTGQK